MTRAKSGSSTEYERPPNDYIDHLICWTNRSDGMPDSIIGRFLAQGSAVWVAGKHLFIGDPQGEHHRIPLPGTLSAGEASLWITSEFIKVNDWTYSRTEDRWL